MVRFVQIFLLQMDDSSLILFQLLEWLTIAFCYRPD